MKVESNAKAALVGEVLAVPQREKGLDVASRRQLLFSARMRFSSETQSIRQQAVDRIIEQNLGLSDSETGLSVREIQEQRIVAMPDGSTVLPREEIQAGLARLVATGRVAASAGEPTRYRVEDRVQAEIWRMQAVCEERLSSIIHRLFKGAQKGASIYKKPFMECLCFIFSSSRRGLR